MSIVDTVIAATTVAGNMAAEAAVPALAVLESTNESRRNYHSGV
jgi:hypothetical protein